MSDTPVPQGLHSTAHLLRDRFEVARRNTVAKQHLLELLSQRKWAQASAVAEALAGPLPRYQVVPSARSRT